MTFKVKQKSVWNYYDILPNKNKDTEFKFKIYDEKGVAKDVNPQFNFNWPGDFCSLIDKSKVAVEFEYEGI